MRRNCSVECDVAAVVRIIGSVCRDQLEKMDRWPFGRRLDEGYCCRTVVLFRVEQLEINLGIIGSRGAKLF